MKFSFLTVAALVLLVSITLINCGGGGGDGGGGGGAPATVYPSGKYAYVANAVSNTVSQYTINATGGLTPMTTATVAAGDPWSVTTTGTIQ